MRHLLLCTTLSSLVLAAVSPAALASSPPDPSAKGDLALCDLEGSYRANVVDTGEPGRYNYYWNLYTGDGAIGRNQDVTTLGGTEFQTLPDYVYEDPNLRASISERLDLTDDEKAAALAALDARSPFNFLAQWYEYDEKYPELISEGVALGFTVGPCKALAVFNGVVYFLLEPTLPLPKLAWDGMVHSNPGQSGLPPLAPVPYQTDRGTFVVYGLGADDDRDRGIVLDHDLINIDGQSIDISGSNGGDFTRNLVRYYGNPPPAAFVDMATPQSGLTADGTTLRHVIPETRGIVITQVRDGIYRRSATSMPDPAIPATNYYPGFSVADTTAPIGQVCGYVLNVALDDPSRLSYEAQGASVGQATETADAESGFWIRELACAGATPDPECIDLQPQPYAGYSTVQYSLAAMDTINKPHYAFCKQVDLAALRQADAAGALVVTDAGDARYASRLVFALGDDDVGVHKGGRTLVDADDAHLTDQDGLWGYLPVDTLTGESVKALLNTTVSWVSNEIVFDEAFGLVAEATPDPQPGTPSATTVFRFSVTPGWLSGAEISRVEYLGPLDGEQSGAIGVRAYLADESLIRLTASFCVNPVASLGVLASLCSFEPDGQVEASWATVDIHAGFRGNVSVDLALRLVSDGTTDAGACLDGVDYCAFDGVRHRLTLKIVDLKADEFRIGNPLLDTSPFDDLPIEDEIPFYHWSHYIPGLDPQGPYNEDQVLSVVLATINTIGLTHGFDQWGAFGSGLLDVVKKIPPIPIEMDWEITDGVRFGITSLFDGTALDGGSALPAPFVGMNFLWSMDELGATHFVPPFSGNDNDGLNGVKFHSELTGHRIRSPRLDDHALADATSAVRNEPVSAQAHLGVANDWLTWSTAELLQAIKFEHIEDWRDRVAALGLSREHAGIDIPSAPYVFTRNGALVIRWPNLIMRYSDDVVVDWPTPDLLVFTSGFEDYEGNLREVKMLREFALDLEGAVEVFVDTAGLVKLKVVPGSLRMHSIQELDRSSLARAIVVEDTLPNEVDGPGGALLEAMGPALDELLASSFEQLNDFIQYYVPCGSVQFHSAGVNAKGLFAATGEYVYANPADTLPNPSTKESYRCLIDLGPPEDETTDKTTDISGVVFQFGGDGIPVPGARVGWAEQPDVYTHSDENGLYTLTVPLASSGDTPVTISMAKTGFRKMSSKTLHLSRDNVNVGETSVMRQTFHLQSIPMSFFAAYEALVNAQIEGSVDDSKCNIAGTVSDLEKFSHYDENFDGSLTVDYAGFLADNVHGFVGATVTLSRQSEADSDQWAPVGSAHGPVYTDDRAIPDTGLSQTSSDGGVLFYNLEPGIYKMMVTDSGSAHDGELASFNNPVFLDCRSKNAADGRFINVGPPQSHALGSPPDLPLPR